MVDYSHCHYKISKRQACKLFNIRESVYYYTPKPTEDHLVREQLSELAETHTRWGFWMMHHRLRHLGFDWNHKKVYRIYTQMGLNLRRKYKRRLPMRVKKPLLQPLLPNLTWSMDFMQDSLIDGSKVRSFNVIDDFNREALNITIDKSINSKRVVRELNKLIQWRGSPEELRVDNGPEFIAHTMQQWCYKHHIELKFIQKGKPSQNGYIERFNRTYREEILDCHLFDSIEQLRLITYSWMWMYNNQRPHSSLAYNTPVNFALKYGKVLHAQGKHDFPTFQHESNSIIKKNLFLNTPKTG